MSFRSFLLNPALGVLWKTQLVVALIIYCYLILSSSPINLDMNYSDKLMHYLGNFLLYGSFWLATVGRIKPILLLLALVPFVAAMEFSQYFTATRQVDMLDLGANILGLISGWLVCLSIQKLARI